MNNNSVAIIRANNRLRKDGLFLICGCDNVVSIIPYDERNNKTFHVRSTIQVSSKASHSTIVSMVHTKLNCC